MNPLVTSSDTRPLRPRPTDDDVDYHVLEANVRRITSRAGDQPLFSTDAANLFDLFLSNLPPDRRQHYTCHCCRRFVDHYGGLVTINERGEQTPFLWHDAPPMFAKALAEMDLVISKAKVTGVFLWREPVWGNPKTGEWTHMAGQPAKGHFEHVKLSPHQAMAEKQGDFAILKRALSEIPLVAAEQAVRILEADALDRSEKKLGVANFFLSLHKAIGEQPNKQQRDNIIWRAVAEAPTGFCHIRSDMLSTLFDDLLAGMSFEEVKNRWAAKMHPLKYQRPTAIKEGNLDRANEIVKKLGSEASLRRRFAKLEDITYRLWEPTPLLPPAKEETGGAFDHLKKAPPAKLSKVDLPLKTLTLVKFLKEELPRARELYCKVPYGLANYGALITAIEPTAPVLFQWDNHVSWYVYYGGSKARDWSLIPGMWVKVPLLTWLPPHWGYVDPETSPFKHENPALVMPLEGAWDNRHTQGGAWFPESLKSEYHEIRGAMEAFAKTAKIAGAQEGSANGLLLSKGKPWGDVEVKVVHEGGTALFKLDRWD